MTKTSKTYVKHFTTLNIFLSKGNRIKVVENRVKAKYFERQVRLRKYVRAIYYKYGRGYKLLYDARWDETDIRIIINEIVSAFTLRIFMKCSKRVYLRSEYRICRHNEIVVAKIR